MTEEKKAPEEEVNLAEMSDDEISNLDFTSLGEEPEDTNSSPDDDLGVDLGTSAADAEDTDNAEDETGGADDLDASEESDGGSADSTSTEDEGSRGNEPFRLEQPLQEPGSDQESDTTEKASKSEEAEPEELDPKEELARIFAPFKAAKREIRVQSVDEVRSLMQKGVDYARKTADMKPYMRVLKTLEVNGLLDEEKVNFLIDLDKKNPEAIKKFLKDSEYDPTDLSLEDDTNDYKPVNHMIGDKQLQLNTVLDEIRETPVFARTVNVITKEWDEKSRQVLMDEPEVIKHLNDHMGNGIYDQIMNVVENERALDRIPPGLSDLDAYKAVGDAMHKANAFNVPSAQSNTDQGFSQDSGSKSPRGDSDIKNRKRAASPTKGTAGAGKAKVDLSKLSDEEIEKLDYATL